MDTTVFLLFAIGLMAAFFGTLVGGGGLLSLPAMLLAGIPVQLGIATNKFSSGIAALANAGYLWRKRQISLRGSIPMLLLACAGGVCGALVTVHLSERTMSVAALILLAFALFVTLKNRQWTAAMQDGTHAGKPTRFGKWGTFLISLYDGGFGPGSSTLAILLFLKQGQSYQQAAQTTRMLILGSCLGGFLVFCQTGFLNWSYAIPLAIGSIAGSQLGLLVLPRIPLAVVRKMLIGVIILLMLQVSWKIIG